MRHWLSVYMVVNNRGRSRQGMPIQCCPAKWGNFQHDGGERKGEGERGEHTMMECENEKGRKGKDSRLERNRWREERERGRVDKSR